MTNGHSSGGNEKFHAAVSEITGLGLGEMASAMVSIGVFTLADDIAPHLMQKAGKVVGKVCIEPFLDTIEWGLQKTCRLKECQPDFTKSREERAEAYGRYLTRFGLSLAPALFTEYVVRKTASHVLDPAGKNVTLWHDLTHPKRHDGAIFGLDKGVQLGGIVAVNTVFAKHADDGIEAISGLLQKSFGWKKDRADRAANVLVVWHLADGLGFLAAAGKIAHHHYGPSKG